MLNNLVVVPGYPRRTSTTWRYFSRVDAALAHGQYLDVFNVK